VELDASIRGFMYFNKHVDGFYSTREEWNNRNQTGYTYSGWDFESNPLTKNGATDKPCGEGVRLLPQKLLLNDT
jgi:hypothetical protein